MLISLNVLLHFVPNSKDLQLKAQQHKNFQNGTALILVIEDKTNTGKLVSMCSTQDSRLYCLYYIESAYDHHPLSYQVYISTIITLVLL